MAEPDCRPILFKTRTLMPNACVILLFNLLQDVNILRPLAYMAKRDLGFETGLFVTRKFEKRDRTGNWLKEINEISGATGASIDFIESEFDAQQKLQGRAGVLFAASESNLSAHDIVHNILRLKPSTFIAVTLQHGFECVGFLQSRDHDIAHGREVTFGADIVCGWCDESRLTALAPSQKNKLLVTGPTALLQQPPKVPRENVGIVCENLHSVRLNVAGDFKTDFVTFFNEFCTELAKEGKNVVLRPHPGGQYVIKNKLALPENVALNNNPIYKVNLSKYAYGISAPSSMLIDMMLAGIPTAVWRDSAGKMDADNYEGVTAISSLQDWLDFEREASLHPERFLERQEQYLVRQSLVLDPKVTYQRFAQLMSAAMERAQSETRVQAPARTSRRVLYIANNLLPTLQLCFLKPLQPLVDAGSIVSETLTEEEVRERFGKKVRSSEAADWMDQRLSAFKPDMIVFCRYSGPHAERMTSWAERYNVPVIFHIDDDLLNVPIELGEAKHAFHNHPDRISTVRHLLDQSDLVYCSNQNLHARLETLGAQAPLKAGKINASGRVIVPAREKVVQKVGYMGFDHAHDLDMIKPTVIEFLRQNPDIQFELFGSIPRPPEFAEFGDRIRTRPPIRNYDEFLESFALQEWDIGICPLVSSPFNLVKSNNKWVEYTSVGAAVIASCGTIYDDCCADGCGILAGSDAEWLEGLNRLARDPHYRYQQVLNAQAKLASEYTVERLREQVLKTFDEAVQNRRGIKMAEAVPGGG